MTRATCSDFLAKQHPTDLNAQIAAAYACARAGDEHQAVRFYEIAWALGIPCALRFEFLIGLSSTLRNEHPDNAALAAFMALTWHALGHTELALATMREAALKAENGKGLAPYTRALTKYRDDLSAAGYHRRYDYECRKRPIAEGRNWPRVTGQRLRLHG